MPYMCKKKITIKPVVHHTWDIYWCQTTSLDDIKEKRVPKTLVDLGVFYGVIYKLHMGGTRGHLRIDINV